MSDKRNIIISYGYCGYESTSKVEHVGAVQMMEDAIEYGDDEKAIVTIEDNKEDFSGVIEIDTTATEEEFSDEDYLDMLKEYCEPGYDNELGGYYEFEII